MNPKIGSTNSFFGNLGWHMGLFTRFYLGLSNKEPPSFLLKSSLFYLRLVRSRVLGAEGTRRNFIVLTDSVAFDNQTQIYMVYTV